MRRWWLPTGPLFWIAAVQAAWTVTLVLWIVFFVRVSAPSPSWGVLVSGILLLVIIPVGVTIIVIHLARQVSHSQEVKDFIGRVSHDLRSPLATVKLHLETLRMRELDAAQRRACLDAALQELMRLEGGIENVLTASRVDRAKLKVASQSTDLRGFLRDYAESRRADVQLQGGSLELEDPEGPAMVVQADHVLLRQLLDNLVDNALNHCPKGVRIRIELAAQAGAAVVTVADDGPGLDQSEWKAVFGMFYRGARSRRHTKGTGLGLFIVRGIAQAHGGRAWVDSPGLGKGCNFRVAFPMSKEVA